MFSPVWGAFSEACVSPFLPRALKQQIVDNLSFKVKLMGSSQGGVYRRQSFHYRSSDAMDRVKGYYDASVRVRRQIHCFGQ